MNEIYSYHDVTFRGAFWIWFEVGHSLKHIKCFFMYYQQIIIPLQVLIIFVITIQILTPFTMCLCWLDHYLTVIIIAHSDCASTVILRFYGGSLTPPYSSVLPDHLRQHLTHPVFVESAAVITSDLQTSYEQMQCLEARTRQSTLCVCVCVCVCVWVGVCGCVCGSDSCTVVQHSVWDANKSQLSSWWPQNERLHLCVLCVRVTMRVTPVGP